MLYFVIMLYVPKYRLGCKNNTEDINRLSYIFTYTLYTFILFYSRRNAILKIKIKNLQAA